MAAGCESLFSAGYRVRVKWMDEPVEATVYELLLISGHPHKTPLYLLNIPGVSGHPCYRHDEMESA